MKTIIFSHAIILAGVLWASAEQPAAQQTQQQRVWKHCVPELDSLIEAIHLDLKALSKTHRWLAEYTDKCLPTKNANEPNGIYYMLEQPGERVLPQPSHIFVKYVPMESDLGENSVRDVPVCEFPSLKSKIWAKILIRGKTNANTADAIHNCIVKRCEALHKAMTSKKSSELGRRVPELDRVVNAIHSDLKRLRKDVPWLSEYTDECLGPENRCSIVYSPKLPDRWKDVPPLPDFMLIEYIPIDLNPSENSAKDVPVCEFPSLKSKVFARIQILSAVDPKTADAVRSCIIKRCEALHKEMKREKAANPQKNNGVSQRSRKRVNNE